MISLKVPLCLYQYVFGLNRWPDRLYHDHVMDQLMISKIRLFNCNWSLWLVSCLVCAAGWKLTKALIVHITVNKQTQSICIRFLIHLFVSFLLTGYLSMYHLFFLTVIFFYFHQISNTLFKISLNLSTNQQKEDRYFETLNFTKRPCLTLIYCHFVTFKLSSV